MRNVQFHCWGLTRRRVGPWDPFECSLELASWTLGEEEIEVTVVVDQDDEDQHRFDRFGINLGLDDSAGVRTNIYLKKKNFDSFKCFLDFFMGHPVLLGHSRQCVWESRCFSNI